MQTLQYLPYAIELLELIQVDHPDTENTIMKRMVDASWFRTVLKQANARDQTSLLELLLVLSKSLSSNEKVGLDRATIVTKIYKIVKASENDVYAKIEKSLTLILAEMLKGK